MRCCGSRALVAAAGLGVSCLAGVALARAAAHPATAMDLVRALKGVTAMEAHFREEKHLAMLAAPLVSEGVIYFLAPDHLLRRVTSPAPSAMVIDGKSISFSDGHGRYTLSLDETPVARVFVDGFLRILQGDPESLGQLYEMTALTRPGGGWGLRLTPRAKPLRELIASIDMTWGTTGRGAVMDGLRVIETGGDETTTTFTAVNTARTFSDEERKRLFGPEAAAALQGEVAGQLAPVPPSTRGDH